MKFGIKAKLGAGFGAITVLVLISVTLVYLRLADIKRKVDLMDDNNVPSLDAARRLQTDFRYVASKARQAILAGTEPSRLAKAQATYQGAWTTLETDLTTLEKLSAGWSDEKDFQRLKGIREHLSNMRRDQQSAIDVAASGDREEVIKAGDLYADRVTPASDSVTKSADDLCTSLDESLSNSKKQLSSAVISTLWTLGITISLTILTSLAVSFLLSRGISLATLSVLKQAETIAAGDLTGEEARVVSQDELGDLTIAVNKMQTSLRRVIESIAQNARSVAHASEQFSTVSQQISANSEETSAQANAVTAATDQVNRGLQTVASSTEEMTASIREIAKNATEAAKVADNAMKTAGETNEIVAKLGASSAEIGQVIKVITSIAQKTDLLALNATVEAARAGNVGAGFAVVANEVKELAKQTANATEDISRKIAAIQADAKSAVSAIASISGVIGMVNDISGSIASAVEEQSATTAEMSRNVAEAARGSREVAQNIQGVAQAAQSTSQGAIDLLNAAKSLAHMSTELRELVDLFNLERNRQLLIAERTKVNGAKQGRERREFEEELASK
jgi:methyl-accepting chemotaxis protein